MSEIGTAKYLIRWELKRLKKRRRLQHLLLGDVYSIIAVRRTLGEIYRLLNAFSSASA